MGESSIAVAVDGSDASIRAVQSGNRLSRATGRRLKLLHVHPDPGKNAPGLEFVGRKRLREAGQASAREIFDQARSALGAADNAPEEVLLWGDPAEEIISYMTANPDFHLVMGRRGLSRLKSLLLGSVTDKVIRHSPGLVTVVD